MSSGKRLVIVADAHVWAVRSAFSRLPGYRVTLTTLEHADICRRALANADILITRSSTRVDAALLEGTPVRFAATATIGDDHYDKSYLESRGIMFANAAGSSTGSVVEYMMAVLLELHARHLVTIPTTSIGIIGAGRIGGEVERCCRQLGMPVLINDPPRAKAEGGAGFSSLETVLGSADVISLHTPLTHKGEDPTFHLIGAKALHQFHGCGIINAGRGACLDNQALLDWLNADAGRWAVLDCWENEPDISTALLAHPGVIIATPHIAGHSLDGKAANTQFVYNALCRFLGIRPAWDMRERLPPVETHTIRVSSGCDALTDLQAAIRRLYDIRRDDRALREAGRKHPEMLADAFVQLRRHYPVRRAWHHYSVEFTPPHEKRTRLAAAIGLHVR